ncbi:purine/pyrimidine permease [Desulfosporosinus fructosivorans]
MPKESLGLPDSKMKKLLRFDTLIYGLQHLIFGVANAAAVPIVVGTALGLNSMEIGELAQRTFFLAGIACLLQAFFGHKYPIFEGPAGVWYSTFVVLGGLAVLNGKPLSLLRTDLMTGLIAAGVMTMSLGIFGLMPYVRKLFTPVVNSTFLMVMSLQFTSTIAKGLLTTVGGNLVLSPNKLVVFFITVGTTLYLSIKAKGFAQSVAVLIGTSVGWVAAYVAGLAPSFATGANQHVPIIALPRFLAWGTPTFDLGVTLTAMTAGLVVLSNVVASVAGMDSLNRHEETGAAYNKTVICTGFADILAGVGSVVGFVPYASSIGFATLTCVLDLFPFILGSTLMIILGVIPGVGSFFATLPITVGYAVMFSVFVVIMGMGIKEASKEGMDTRKMVILGFSVLIGNSITLLPIKAFSMLPASMTYLVANGLIVAVLVSLVLEHVILKKGSSQQDGSCKI